jgi:hypothetical protein
MNMIQEAVSAVLPVYRAGGLSRHGKEGRLALGLGGVARAGRNQREQ